MARRGPPKNVRQVADEVEGDAGNKSRGKEFRVAGLVCSRVVSGMYLNLHSSDVPLLLAFLLLVSVTSGFSAEQRSLAERLGYKSTDKILIVNGDDTGMCHAANLATIESLEKGLMRSATIMVPCPWFPEIAAYAKPNPEKNFGIHLCH